MNTETANNKDIETGPRAGQHRWFFKNIVKVIATGAETNGQYAMFEVYGPPGDRTPYHMHDHEEEAFWVIEGQMTVWIGDNEPVILNPGQYFNMPRNIPHAYQATSDQPVRYIGITSPASRDEFPGFESFVYEISIPAERDELPQPSAPTPERLKEMFGIGRKHGITLYGPGYQPKSENQP